MMKYCQSQASNTFKLMLWLYLVCFITQNTSQLSTAENHFSTGHNIQARKHTTQIFIRAKIQAFRFCQTITYKRFFWVSTNQKIHWSHYLESFQDSTTLVSKTVLWPICRKFMFSVRLLFYLPGNWVVIIIIIITLCRARFRIAIWSNVEIWHHIKQC